jgi:hypothetical protein
MTQYVPYWPHSWYWLLYWQVAGEPLFTLKLVKLLWSIGSLLFRLVHSFFHGGAIENEVRLAAVVFPGVGPSSLGTD